MVSMYLRIYLSTHPSIHPSIQRSRLSIHLSVCLSYLSIRPFQVNMKDDPGPTRHDGQVCIDPSIQLCIHPSIYIIYMIATYLSIAPSFGNPSVHLSSLHPSIHPSSAVVLARVWLCLCQCARACVCMSCPLPPLGTRRQLDPPLYLEQCARAPQSTQSLLSFQVVPNADEKVPAENSKNR